jgi:hypothetical protein
MTYDEFLTAKSELEIKYKADLNRLLKECAMSNNPVKIGDIVQDRNGTIIKVEQMIVMGTGSVIPSCRYYGSSYTKKLVPFKNGQHETIYQSNLKIINGEAYDPNN